jgi:hypothetical protein
MPKPIEKRNLPKHEIDKHPLSSRWDLAGCKCHLAEEPVYIVTIYMYGYWILDTGYFSVQLHTVVVI